MFVQTNKRISNPNLRCHFEGAGVSFLLSQNIRDREISFQKLIQLFWKLLTPFWTNNGATFLNHEVHKVFCTEHTEIPLCSLWFFLCAALWFISCSNLTWLSISPDGRLHFTSACLR